MAERLFTLEEAMALLPTVRQILTETQARKHDVEERSAALDRLLEATGGDGHLAADLARARQALEQAATELQRLIGELEATGAELKGIDEGLVDFPNLREGRVVYLCWRLGEETIAYWHELDAGFAGREPL